jgi:glycosyltransferase involved in cell wall biosynthesis
MNISIIIPTYNRSYHICKTIDSFVKQKYKSGLFEIIIVDNNSTDDTKNIIHSYIEKNKTLVNISYLFESRQGVHFARNSAISKSKYEILYFTDDDMLADENLLSEIIKPFLFDKKVATATGKVLPIWEKTPPNWILKHFSNQYLSLFDTNDDFLITKQINFLYSCHQLIKKEVLIECEGYNPEYVKDRYLGDGETGLNNKLKQKGYKFGMNASSLIYHIIPSSRITQKYINKRFANGAAAHCYSEYRMNKSLKKTIRNTVVNILFKFPITITTYILQTLIKRDIGLLHFIPAQVAYHIQSLKYNLNILFNKKFRDFVLKSNWLSNDT